MSNNARQRTRLPKASDILADQLRGRILGDGLEPGDRLPSEVELVDASELSRGTVRETLRLLETEGLIEIRRGPRGGITVRHPDAGHVGRSFALLLTLSQAPLRQLIEFRKVVEPEAASAAALQIDDELRQRILHQIDDDMGIAEFHGQVGLWSGNEMYRVVLAAIHDLVNWQSIEEDLTEEDLKVTREVHKKIAQAIAEGKDRLAANRMRKHLEGFEEVLRKQGRLDKPIVPRHTWRSRTS